MGGGRSTFEERHLVGGAATEVREANPQPTQAAVAGSIARKGAHGCGSTNAVSCRGDCWSDGFTYYAIQDTALEVSESEETLSWWDMCLGDLTLAGAAPTFPEGASVFDTPAEATVTRFCLLRGDFLILVLQGFFEYGNVMIRNFRPHPEGGFEKPLALDCTTTPATLTKDTDVKMETTFRRNIFSWNSNMPLKI